MVRLAKMKEKKALDGLIVWAGLIATVAYAAFITIPPGVPTTEGNGDAGLANNATALAKNVTSPNDQRSFRPAQT